MEGAVAEGLLQHAAALEEESEVEFVGDTDAAMHLHRLVERRLAEVRGPGLGQADQGGCGVGSPVQRLERAGKAALEQLDLDEQPRSAMLQRLCGNLQLDITKTRELLGWAPPLGVDEALRRAVQAPARKP